MSRCREKVLILPQVEHLHSEDERPVEEGEEEEEEEGDDEEDIYQLDLPSAELCADYWQIHKMVKVRRTALGINCLGIERQLTMPKEKTCR